MNEEKTSAGVKEEIPANKPPGVFSDSLLKPQLFLVVIVHHVLCYGDIFLSHFFWIRLVVERFIHC